MQKQILVVENDPDLLRAMTRRLEIAGYGVVPAATIVEAKERVEQTIIHLAIIDIRATNDRSETDRSGFHFTRSLPRTIPFLIHTAHDTKEHIRQALSEIGAADIIAKTDPDGPAQLMACVQRVFAERVAVNFGLTLTSATDLDDLATLIECPVCGNTQLHNTKNRADRANAREVAPAIEETKCTETNYQSAKPTGADIELLIRRLLPDALHVTLKPLLSAELQLSHSQSGAILFKVHETRAEGSPVPMVLKVGAAQLIEDEATRYRLLQPYLGGQRLAHLEGEAYSRAVGGLLYTLVGADAWGTIAPLATQAAQAEPATIEATLRHFFRQTFGPIQQQPQPTAVDLAAHYTAALGLTEEKLVRAIGKWFPEVLDGEMLPITGRNGAIRNPVTWAVQHGTWRSRGSVATYTVLCHGDLHGRNVLVDGEGNGWLIDFGRAERSHYLRDFVELEVDLRLQFAPEIALGTMLDFEKALLAPEPLVENAAWPALLTRLHRLVVAIRHSANELTVGELPMHEYHEALFWHLLNAIRLRAMSVEQKGYALRAAGLLADWL